MEQKQSQEFAQMKESSEASSTVKNIEAIEGTPFGIVTTNAEDENNTFVAIGNKRISELQPRENSERMIDEKEWPVITQLVMHLIEHVDDIKTINEAYRKGVLA